MAELADDGNELEDGEAADVVVMTVGDDAEVAELELDADDVGLTELMDDGDAERLEEREDIGDVEEGTAVDVGEAEGGGEVDPPKVQTPLVPRGICCCQSILSRKRTTRETVVGTKRLTLGPKYVIGTSTVDTPVDAVPSTIVVNVDADRYAGSACVGSTAAVDTNTVETPVMTLPSLVTVNVEAESHGGSSWVGCAIVTGMFICKTELLVESVVFAGRRPHRGSISFPSSRQGQRAHKAVDVALREYRG